MYDQRSYLRLATFQILHLTSGLRHQLLILLTLLLERTGSRAVLDVAVGEVVLANGLGDLSLVHLGELLSGLHVAHLLSVTLGENEIDLLEGTASSLGVEEVDDGDEGCVECGEEEVGSPANVGDQDGCNHDNEEVP